MSLSRLGHEVGFWIRETGQALDRLGLRLQGSVAFRERLNRHRRVMNFGVNKPAIGNETFIAPSASVIGQVEIGDKSSVWYNTVVRGDINLIRIGSGSSLQDRVIVHVSKMQKDEPTIIGDRVTIENGAILHGCTIEDESYVGVGATILDGAKVQKNSMVAAGALVTNNTVIPSGQLWAGAPAKFLRNLTPEEIASISQIAEANVALAAQHAAEGDKSFEEVEHEKILYKVTNERSPDYVSRIGYGV